MKSQSKKLDHIPRFDYFFKRKKTLFFWSKRARTICENIEKSVKKLQSDFDSPEVTCSMAKRCSQKDTMMSPTKSCSIQSI
jgi:hypothetical protein